jgi:hypothetical protein
LNSASEDSIHDPKACQKRVEKVKKMFAEKLSLSNIAQEGTVFT